MDDPITAQEASPELVALVRAAAAFIEHGGHPCRFSASAGPEESVALCVGTLLVPLEQRDRFMAAWVAVSDALARVHGIDELVRSAPPSPGAH